MLEVVGVTGVVHLGQIQSGLRSAIRIVQVRSRSGRKVGLSSIPEPAPLIPIQGSHIKIRTNTELPVQVDGEPWIQTPGDIVVLKSALKVSPAKEGGGTENPGCASSLKVGVANTGVAGKQLCWTHHKHTVSLETAYA